MTNSLEIICPTTGGEYDAAETWMKKASEKIMMSGLGAIEGKEAGFLYKLQQGYLESDSDLLAYFHSDLFIHEEDWNERVLAAFEDESVGIVGFGGGKRLGSPDIYRIPYKLQQLARFDFVSNLRDAEVHGRRNRNEEDIAVVDSFALIIRRSLLDRMGGWPVQSYPPMHCSDTFACLMAHRYHMRVVMVGISCTHKSGGVKGNGTFDYSAWQNEIGMTDQEQHTKAHALIYSQFRSELPIVIP